MKRLLLLLFLVTQLGGCASDAKIKPLLHSMNSSNQAISAFGPPDSVSQMPDGAMLYIWQTSTSYGGGGYQPFMRAFTGAGRYASFAGLGMTYSPVQQVDSQCVLKIIAETNGDIRTWSYHGNACDSLLAHTTAAAPARTSQTSQTSQISQISEDAEDGQ